MSIYFDDLDELDNVLDKVKPDVECIKILEEDKSQLIDSVLQIMEDYINDNPSAIIEEDFHEIFIENITELMKLQLGYSNDDHVIDSSDEEMEESNEILHDIIEETAEYFYENFMPERSFEGTFLTNEAPKDIISQKLKYLREKPQPAQRTNEWYEFRHNLITASNAYKAFEGESTRNQLIYEKCQPLQISEKTGFVNINTPFHHGQKYEPLSVMIYEDKYNVKVGDFGCIQHEKYSFLGASPDGINVDISSPTYGRMLEIKNIVNRVIDGIPKKEYWVQMQMQMEICDLDECDFLETKFTEYLDTDDSSAHDKFTQDGETFNKTSRSQVKGVILYFAKKDGNPNYVYCPLNITDAESFAKWEEEMQDLYQSPEYNMTWIKNIYWKMEQYSCVLVLRNKEWFARSICKLEEVWNIIVKERTTGYQHRAPTKRVKKEAAKLDPLGGTGCLLNFNKGESKFIMLPKQVTSTTTLTKTIPEMFIKIRTESFDETKKNIL